MKRTLTLLVAAVAATALAQNAEQDTSADTKTIDTTVAALYDVISGPAGAKRDWARFRNLFAAGARLVANVKRGEKFATVVMSVDDFVTKAGPAMESQGFFEQETGKRTERYGPMAQVFTAYESRLKSKEEKPIERGINGVQLTFDGDRWWIQSVSWAGESAAGPVPEDLLKKGLKEGS